MSSTLPKNTNHQQITTSAILAKDASQKTLLVDIACKFKNGSREDMSGWQGDITLEVTVRTKEGQTSMSPSDYVCDLDAANIAQKMKDDGTSYIDASNMYYAKVGEDNTRAEIFMETRDIGQVKETIFGSPFVEGFVENATTEAEKMKIIGEKLPDTYCFIKSIEDPQNHHEMAVVL